MSIDTLREQMGNEGDNPDIVATIADNIPGFWEFWESYLYGLAFTHTIMGEDNDSQCEEWKNPGGDIRDVVDTDDVANILKECGKYDELLADCVSFVLDAFDMIEDDMENAGSDFHLTRNRHGAGFWDGDWPEHGDTLTALSKPYGTAELIGWIDTTEEAATLNNVIWDVSY